MINNNYQTEIIEFESAGIRCTGRLHRPLNVDRPPVVLMGNGLATEWHFGTADFIAAFTAAGMATFNFDYRYFGESDGQPRQLLDFAGQLNDWHAALQFLRHCARVDGRRIALWGSSLGGGHALSLAAQTTDLRAVVVQVPHLDSRNALKVTPKKQIMLTLGHALLDKLGSFLGLSPHCIPVLAEPGEVGLLTKPDWKAHYLSLVPVDSRWCNAVPARSIFRAGNYNPIDVLSRIDAPVFIVYGLEDAAIPAVNVELASQRLKQATLWPFPGDHFGVYAGPWHAAIVAEECHFLQERLL